MTTTAIHFAGYHPRHSVQARAVDALAATLARSLGSDVAFRFDPDVGDLGHKAADLLDLVEAGEIDMCYFYSSYLGDRVPELGLFEIPFQISGRSAAYGLLDGPLGRHLADAIGQNTGYRLIAFWDNGIRHISNCRHVIRTPADCRGLKLRTARNLAHQAAFGALGFDPVFVDVKDLGAAAASGAIDAQENPLTNIRNYGLERHHPFITLTGHLFGISAVLANAKAYEAWPSAVKAALGAAIVDATALQRRLAAEEDDICRTALVAAGATLTELTPAERAAFAAATAEVAAAERATFDPALMAAFDLGRG